MSELADPGWRRGDRAAWWDPSARRWRLGELVERRTVHSFEYDLRGPDGLVVTVPGDHLRSPADPDVLATLGRTRSIISEEGSLSERTRRS